MKIRFSVPTVSFALLVFALANGGHPEFDAVDGSSGQYAVNRFYHLSEEDHGPESLWYSIKRWQSILGNKALPFADDGGGNQFFLDMNKDPASVKICLHDKGFRIVEIARSLEEFIDRLQLDPDMI